jgi:hypothetical protein
MHIWFFLTANYGRVRSANTFHFVLKFRLDCVSQIRFISNADMGDFVLPLCFISNEIPAGVRFAHIFHLKCTLRLGFSLLIGFIT